MVRSVRLDVMDVGASWGTHRIAASLAGDPGGMRPVSRPCVDSSQVRKSFSSRSKLAEQVGMH
ncbi:MAG: hypothetical protein EOO27_10675, partial [Comamonadaceae bacterium]